MISRCTLMEKLHLLMSFATLYILMLFAKAQNVDVYINC